MFVAELQTDQSEFHGLDGIFSQEAYTLVYVSLVLYITV